MKLVRPWLLVSVNLSFILYVCSWIIGRNNHNSYFYHRSSIEAIRAHETMSYERSVEYLEQLILPNYSGNISNDKASCFLGIVVLSKNRFSADKSDRFSDNNVIRTMAYLLSRLESFRRNNLGISITVLNNQRPASKNLGLRLLEPLAQKGIIDIVAGEEYASTKALTNMTNLTYNGRTVDIPIVGSSHASALWNYQETFDYAVALLYAEREFTKAKHTIIIQDDAIISRSFLIDILRVIHPQGQLDDRLYAIKLFYMDRFSGWGKDNVYVLILIAIGIGLTATWVTFFICRLEKKRNLLVVLFVYYTGFGAILLVLISRQALFPTFKGTGLVPVSNYMASLVAQLYPRNRLGTLAKGVLFHLGNMIRKKDSRKKNIVDYLTDRVARENGWKQFVLVPNVVQHIGRQSSRTTFSKKNLVYVSTSDSFPLFDEEF
jgi:hypothetical protein